mgnify:CR=1 FL=1|jgi:SHS2 domain-containing protein
MAFELLDHPADVKFRATGSTRSAAFASVVDALAAVVGTTVIDAPARERAVSVVSESVEALVFDFLAELLFVQDVDGVAVASVSDLEITEVPDGLRLTGTLSVVPIPPDRPLADVKAPTYSELSVTEDDGWTIEAVLDV